MKVRQVSFRHTFCWSRGNDGPDDEPDGCRDAWYRTHDHQIASNCNCNFLKALCASPDFFGRKANRWIQWRFNSRHPWLVFRGSSNALANDRNPARWQVKQSRGCQAHERVTYPSTFGLFHFLASDCLAVHWEVVVERLGAMAHSEFTLEIKSAEKISIISHHFGFI